MQFRQWERLLMLPVDDDLLSEQELKDYGVDIDALNAFKFLTGPGAGTTG